MNDPLTITRARLVETQCPAPSHATGAASIIPLQGYRRSYMANSAHPEILAKPGDLVHPLVQDGDDADPAIIEPAPVDEMVLVAKEVPVDTELRRDGSRRDPRGSRSSRTRRTCP